MKSFFTPKEITRLVGISYRQVQYWDKTKFIAPSYRRRGKYRLYTFSDVVLLWLAQTLHTKGMSIQNLRKIIVQVRSHFPHINVPMRDVTFMVSGSSVLIFTGTLVAQVGMSEKPTYTLPVMNLVRSIEELWPDEFALPEAAA